MHFLDCKLTVLTSKNTRKLVPRSPTPRLLANKHRRPPATSAASRRRIVAFSFLDSSNETPPRSIEAQKWFLRRMESQGWTNVRQQLPTTAAPTEDAHPLVQEAWLAMQSVYGLGVIETPLESAPWLAEASKGGIVSLKMETKQVTGSFKARGAAHKLLSLPPTATHIITSSTGNHALAVLHAVSALQSARYPSRKLTATVFVPETISTQKATKLQTAAKAAGANIVIVGRDCVEAENAARIEAETSGQVYISPYNDIQVAGGQGTIAFELLMQLSAEHPPDCIFIPVGGGGLISGIAAVLKTLAPSIKIVGCQPELSDVMRQSVIAGHIVELPWEDTLSDGTAGGIEDPAITLEYCSEFVDEWVTVSEEEIATAMVHVERHHGVAVEGSAGVAVAAYAKVAEVCAGKHAVVVCCGGNVAVEALQKAYEVAGMVKRGGSAGTTSSSRDVI